MQSQQNGSLPIYLEETGGLQPSHRELSWTGSDKSTENKKKHTFKGTSTAAKFVARLSPKSMRRRNELHTALTKVWPTVIKERMSCSTENPLLDVYNYKRDSFISVKTIYVGNNNNNLYFF